MNKNNNTKKRKQNNNMNLINNNNNMTIRNDNNNNNVSIENGNNNNNKKLKMQQQEKKKLQIHFHLYQPTLFLPKLQVDQLSFIFQSASKPFERAHIIEKIVTDHESNFRGRLKVKYTHGQQSTYYVRPKNIIKVIQTDTTTKYHHCIVTKDTNMYRRLAHAQTEPNDIALEIGCDFGYTTKILGTKCKIALGIDKKYSHVKSAIDKYGDDDKVLFHAVDIFKDSDNILGKYSKQLQHNPTIIFIDINGNRELQAVVKALNVVYERFQPRLVVIKSSSFFNYLYDNVDDNSSNNNQKKEEEEGSDNNNTPGATAGIKKDYVYERYQTHFM